MVICISILLFFSCTGEIGFLLLFFLMYFYLLLNYFNGLIVRLNISIDFISFGILFLSLLIIIMIVLVGYYEYYVFNKWRVLIFYLYFLLIFLFFTFRFSSFLMFYLFFEFVLIPTFILIIRWGYRINRIQAALYMFLYTFLSSLPLLIFLLIISLDGVRFFFIYNLFSFSFKDFHYYWWGFFLFVFIVKLPLFLLHLWLPKAHVEAPLLGSMILAGVLLKIGGYGVYKTIVYYCNYFIRLLWWFRSYSIYGGVLIGLICLRQVDIKRLIAFSSVVHIGPVFCSIILVTYSGLLGSYWIIISHGFCSACLFFLLNIVYIVIGSRNLFFLRGGLNYFPFFSFIWFFFCVRNIGFPPTFNFFSEVIIMVGVFSYRNFLIIFFMFLLIIRGFYNILIYFFFNHGSGKNYLINFNLFSIKNILSLYVFFVFLILFVLFINFFC